MFGSIFANYIKQISEKCGVKVLNHIHVNDIFSDEVNIKSIDFSIGEDTTIK